MLITLFTLSKIIILKVYMIFLFLKISPAGFASYASASYRPFSELLSVWWVIKDFELIIAEFKSKQTNSAMFLPFFWVVLCFVKDLGDNFVCMNAFKPVSELQTFFYFCAMYQSVTFTLWLIGRIIISKTIIYKNKHEEQFCPKTFLLMRTDEQ